MNSTFVVGGSVQSGDGVLIHRLSVQRLARLQEVVGAADALPKVGDGLLGQGAVSLQMAEDGVAGSQPQRLMVLNRIYTAK